MALGLALSTLAGCTASGRDTGAYEGITATEAKALMDSGDPILILDVRTQKEYDQGHIHGARLLPNTEIRSQAETLLPDKDQVILVYCRSGSRSKKAAKDLAALGYTNVKDFGGINSWTYGTVAE